MASAEEFPKLTSEMAPDPGVIYIMDEREVIFRKDGSMLDITALTKEIRAWRRDHPGPEPRY